MYDEAKRFAEAMTVAYHRYHGVDTKIVRIFNTYGPRMRVHDGRAVPAFISQALRNEDVTVFGDGTQTRSFSYISDLVDGIIKLMLSDRTRADQHRQPARDDDRGDRAADHHDDGLEEPDHLQAAAHRRPQQRRPDITLARTLLKWEPKVALEQGLVETIDYFRTKVT